MNTDSCLPCLRVTPKVCDVQELQVEQYIFGILTAETAAKNMRHHRYVVFILDGCGYGYGSRTATETVALEQPVAEVLVHVLAAVCGDIDVFRVELP